MIGVMEVEDAMAQTAGRKSGETKLLSPPSSSWSMWSEGPYPTHMSHYGSEEHNELKYEL